MHKYSYRFFGRKSLKTVMIITCSMTIAFVIGVETAGDVQPVVAPTMAGGAVMLGDFNGDGKLTLDDVKIGLEIARGNRVASPSDLAADPNQDFHITLDDVQSMIDTIEHSTL